MKLSKMLRLATTGTTKLSPTHNFQFSTINKQDQLALLTQEC